MENIMLGIIKDIVVGSQMTVHQNVVQLLGCCLETKYFDPTEAVHFEPLTWKCRLRIAMGIANAVANLHTAFSRPIIHRVVRLAITILVENNVAKLIDFSHLRSIPIKPYVEQNWLIEIVDPMLQTEGINQEQILAFAQTALRCISDTADSPTIIDAAKQLRRIYQFFSPP
uniref:Protein kinase domain-containing protein n=1 Tax=Quercus lobata TaxID=97700 RepID=A0A7N2L4U2_QUELO